MKIERVVPDLTVTDLAGTEIVHPLTTEEWGVRRFFYRDPAGRVANVGSHT